MLEKFWKRTGMMEIVISLIFILCGIALILRSEEVVALISIVLGGSCIIIGIIKLFEYIKNGMQDKYIFTTSLLLVILGIITMFYTMLILSIFRVMLAVWILYSGISNLQRIITWKDYQSKLWIFSVLLSIAIFGIGIYMLFNQGAIIQTIGVIILIYGIINLIENLIFIKKLDI